MSVARAITKNGKKLAEDEYRIVVELINMPAYDCKYVGVPMGTSWDQVQLMYKLLYGSIHAKHVSIVKAVPLVTNCDVDPKTGEVILEAENKEWRLVDKKDATHEKRVTRGGRKLRVTFSDTPGSPLTEEEEDSDDE